MRKLLKAFLIWSATIQAITNSYVARSLSTQGNGQLRTRTASFDFGFGLAYRSFHELLTSELSRLVYEQSLQHPPGKLPDKFSFKIYIRDITEVLFSVILFKPMKFEAAQFREFLQAYEVNLNAQTLHSCFSKGFDESPLDIVIEVSYRMKPSLVTSSCSDSSDTGLSCLRFIIRLQANKHTLDLVINIEMQFLNTIKYVRPFITDMFFTAADQQNAVDPVFNIEGALDSLNEFLRLATNPLNANNSYLYQSHLDSLQDVLHYLRIEQLQDSYLVRLKMKEAGHDTQATANSYRAPVLREI